MEDKEKAVVLSEIKKLAGQSLFVATCIFAGRKSCREGFFLDRSDGNGAYCVLKKRSSGGIHLRKDYKNRRYEK